MGQGRERKWNISKEYLVEEYSNKGRSTSDIAKDFGCNHKTINRCSHCGERSEGDLEVHHLIPMRELISEAQKKHSNREGIIQDVLSKHNIDMGVTLKRQCHQNEFHWKVVS